MMINEQGQEAFKHRGKLQPCRGVHQKFCHRLNVEQSGAPASVCLQQGDILRT